MKLIGIRDAKNTLSELVELAQHERVVLTRHGRPALLMVGIEGQDLEEVILREDDGLWKALRERSAAAAKEPAISIDLARRLLRIAPAGKATRGQARPRAAQRAKRVGLK